MARSRRYDRRVAFETDFDNWQQHLPLDDPRYNSCSPNLTQLKWELARQFHMTNNGCYAERDIRAGTLPSSHSHGAAIDENYPDRIAALTVIIPWLINNSKELHLQAIHDYYGSRIWRAGRTSSTADAHSAWWKAQTPNPATGMGQQWALYFHLETNEEGWGDNTPISTRLSPDPPTVPISGALVFTRTIKPGDEGADVAFVQVVIRAPGAVAGTKSIVADGRYGPQTVTAVKNIQKVFGLVDDGLIGPKTQAAFMKLANS